MTKTFGRWVLGLTLAAGGVGVSVPMLVHADEPVPQQLATVDQLKAEAFKALKAGQFDRTRLHADIGEVVAGLKKGRERHDERILVHTTGMVSHDIGIAWRIYRRAKAEGAGVALPTAVAQQAFSPKD